VAIKTILITGGLGCIGRRLGRHLADLGHHVMIGSSRQGASLPESLSDCTLIYTDFNDTKSLSEACLGVDCLLHLATVDAQESQKNPILAIKVNGIGTLNLIHASIQNKVGYFLYFSTAHVYGSPLVGEIDESTLPAPRNNYAISHRLAEDLLLDAISSQTIKGSIIRLSNSIGLPLTKKTSCWSLFVNDACKQAVLNQCITISSSAYIERDFISISAVCKVVEQFLSQQIVSEYSVYNLGSGSSLTLLQISEMIADRCQELFGYRPKIVYPEVMPPSGDKLQYRIDKLIHELGCTIESDLTTSIDEVLRFCHSNCV